jgi:hypothetical protein
MEGPLPTGGVPKKSGKPVDHRRWAPALTFYHLMSGNQARTCRKTAEKQASFPRCSGTACQLLVKLDGWTVPRIVYP